jgi:hypothetical protein
MLKFLKSGSNFKVKVTMSKQKGLVIRNIHMKYEIPITCQSKDMVNVKDFKKWVKLQGQSHKVNTFGTNGKVLS